MTTHTDNLKALSKQQLVDDDTTLAFYKLCSDCNLAGLMDTFGDLSDTTNIDINYAYYMVYHKLANNNDNNNNNSPILTWLLELDSNIDYNRIADDYTADESIPNDALRLACFAGHYKVAKWLLEEEPYLSSFKNRCNICDIFKITCYNGNLDISKMIFELLADYISERNLILNEAYQNAMSNQNAETTKWLLEINPNINTTQICN
jgi:hypothetical protein